MGFQVNPAEELMVTRNQDSALESTAYRTGWSFRSRDLRTRAGFDALMADWIHAGARVKGKTRAAQCAFPDCFALPFADLVTSRGKRAICLAHFNDFRAAEHPPN